MTPEEVPDGSRRRIVLGGDEPIADMRDPNFGDSIAIEIDHRGGPRPEGYEGPITISREAFEGLQDTMAEFVMARLMSHLNQGDDAEKVTIHIDLNVE